MIPGLWMLPVIVNVLPLPVVPYAKTHALYPLITLGIKWAQVFS